MFAQEAEVSPCLNPALSSRFWGGAVSLMEALAVSHFTRRMVIDWGPGTQGVEEGLEKNPGGSGELLRGFWSSMSCCAPTTRSRCQ